jgi:hypothetical protein
MKIKTSDLTGPALDWAVRKTLRLGSSNEYVEARDNYSTCWNKGGPIIEREKIDCIADPNGKDVWRGQLYTSRLQGQRVVRAYGTTPLVAAMRCYVASRLGDEVDVPDELL